MTVVIAVRISVRVSREILCYKRIPAAPGYLQYETIRRQKTPSGSEKVLYYTAIDTDASQSRTLCETSGQNVFL